MFNWNESEENKAYRVKMEAILQAAPDDKRKPNPRGEARFSEENWIEFKVEEDGKEIKLHTYRECSNSKNPKECKAILVQIHGLNSHQNCGAHLAKAYAKLGLNVVGFDFRGFGKSEGYRGYIDSVELLIEDCTKFIDLVEIEYPGKKIFLAGQSLGGACAFQLHLKFPKRFAGEILFVPALKDLSVLSPFMKKVAQVLGVIWPKMSLVPQRRGNANRNRAVAEELMEDPLTYNGPLLPRTVKTCLHMMNKSFEEYEQYDASFLLIHAGKDKLVCPEMSEQLMKRSSSKDKELLFYENAWHNIYMDEDILDIIPKVQDWLKKRI